MKSCRLISVLLTVAISANSFSGIYEEPHASNAVHDPLRVGDLIVLGGCSIPEGCGPTPMYAFSTSGELKSTFAFEPGSNGNLITAPDGTLVAGEPALLRYTRTGEFIGTYPIPGGSPLTFDRAGNLFAVLDTTVYKMSTESVLDTYPLGRVIGAADLASDQCTLFFTDLYTTLTTFHRYDICQHGFLQDIRLADAGRIINFRLLRDDSILLVTAIELIQVAFDGTVLQHREFNGTVNGLALAPGGRVAWIVWTDTPYHHVHLGSIGIDTFEVVSEFNGNDLFPLMRPFTTYGEPRASYDIGKRSRRVRRH